MNTELARDEPPPTVVMQSESSQPTPNALECSNIRIDVQKLDSMSTQSDVSIICQKKASSRSNGSVLPTFTHPDGAAYYHNLPVKPGIEFLQSVLTHRPVDSALSLVPKLMRFPLADTFVFSDLGCVGFVWEGDHVRLVENMSPDEVLLRFDLRDTKDPAGVRKRLIKGSENHTSTVAIAACNLASIVRSSYDCEDFACLQKFVKRARPMSDKPRFLRVCYRPSTKARIGYMVSHGHFPEHNAYKDDSMEVLTRKFCVSFQLQNFFSTKVSGKYLDVPSGICGGITYFMENYFHVRLSEVVVDMIPGNQNEFFVLQVKSFSVVVSSVARSIVPLHNHTVRQLSCSVCRCPKTELPRTTTTKLLIESVAHLNRRGVRIISEKKSLKSGGFVKCCDACYTMVMNEQELMRVRKFFRSIVSKGAMIGSKFAHASNSSSWRMMVSFDRVLDCGASCHQINIKMLDGDLQLYRPGSFCVVSIQQDELNLMDQTVTVQSDSSEGAVERALDTLVSASRFGQEDGSMAHFRVYLGKGRRSVEISIGLERNGCENDPLPDPWVKHLGYV